MHLGEVEGLRRGDLGDLWLRYMWARAAGWNIKFCNLGADVKMLIHRAGIEHVFDIYEDEVQAVASFKQSCIGVLSHAGAALSAKAS